VTGKGDREEAVWIFASKTKNPAIRIAPTASGLSVFGLGRLCPSPLTPEEDDDAQGKQNLANEVLLAAPHALLGRKDHRNEEDGD